MSKAITKVQAIVLVILLVIATIAAGYYLLVPKPVVKKTIKIGILFPLTGALAPFGLDCRRGVETAIEMFVKQSVIPNVEIITVIGDSQSNPTVAASEAERLITVEGVDIIIGSYAGPLAMSIATVAERYSTPLFEVIAAPNELCTRGYKWVFRFGPAGLYYGYAAVDFFVNFTRKMNWDITKLNVAVVHEDGSYGTSCADGDVERLKYYNLLDILKTRERYSSASTDLSALITKLKTMNIDVVIITSYAADAQLFIRQSHELGFKPKLIIGHSAGYELPATATAVGNLINGIFVVGFPLYGMNLQGLLPAVKDDVKAFTDYYQNKYGSLPASWGAKAFSATYHVLLKSVLKIVLEKYGEINKENIRKAFLDVDIPDGGTFVGFGVKFLPPTDPKAGENMRATYHPVCEWFNSTASGLIAVYPPALALREPLYIPRP
ncbi:MAG: ABC transporter substrate-binding protein [Candidatus Methanomethylicia archaeon]